MNAHHHTTGHTAIARAVGQVIVTVHGPLDRDTVPAVEETLVDLARTGGFNPVIIDLGDVSFLDRRCSTPSSGPRTAPRQAQPPLPQGGRERVGGLRAYLAGVAKAIRNSRTGRCALGQNGQDRVPAALART